MSNLIQMIIDSGFAGFAIMTMGVIGLALILERAKALYFDYAIKADDFTNQLKGLVMKDQVEEAITFCSANKKAPLAHVVKGVLERADRDDEGIYTGLDISLSEVIPNLGKRLGYLAMIANVATLIGLLGTILGLIAAFEAVAVADPAQKNTMLSQGISLAMNTTALGLSVAIPVMISYAFLHSRQNYLMEEISEHSSKVVDLLTTRHYQAFSSNNAFPQDLGLDKMEEPKEDEPPAPSKKMA
ncbi:MAG: MotA/TolQ/ExbB proton channel family protein [Bdellovibrionales bacterium]|nr:MotA/TolQ/ExbB proton channel family protein [Bdellovibrionales bacterium]